MGRTSKPLTATEVKQAKPKEKVVDLHLKLTRVLHLELTHPEGRIAGICSMQSMYHIEHDAWNITHPEQQSGVFVQTVFTTAP